jgi:hypothetical protein
MKPPPKNDPGANGPPDPPERIYPTIPTATPPDVVIHLTAVTASDAQLATHPDVITLIQAGLVGQLLTTSVFGGRPRVRALGAPITSGNSTGPWRVMLGIWLWSIVPPPSFLDPTDEATWQQIEIDLKLSQERGLRSACGLVSASQAVATSVAVPSGGNTVCIFASMTMLRRMAIESFSTMPNKRIQKFLLSNIQLAAVPPRSLKTSIDGHDDDTGVQFTLSIDESLRATTDGRVVADPPTSSSNVNMQWLLWILVPISGRLYDYMSAIETIGLWVGGARAASQLSTTVGSALCSALFINRLPLRGGPLDHFLSLNYTMVSTSSTGVLAEGSWALARRVPTVKIIGPPQLVAHASQPIAESVYTLALTDFLPPPTGGYTVTFSGSITSVQPAGPLSATVRFSAAGVAVGHWVTHQLNVTVVGSGADQATDSQSVEVHIIHNAQANPTDTEETKCRKKPWLCPEP